MENKFYNEKILKTPLDAILLSQGYTLKRDKCSKNHITITNENNDLIVITRNNNEHYLYFNPNDDKDRGNIYSFCKNRGIKLKELLQSKDLSTLTHSINPSSLAKKNLELLTQFNDCEDIQKNNHFSKKRLIDEKILLSYNLKQDKIKNILSPTFILDRAKNTNFVAINQIGYVSYLSSPIKKDKEKQEYQKPIKQLCYGHKGLEILKQKTSKKEDILNIIITESMCDSLSLLELKAYNPKNTLLCSTNGAISQNQKELLEYFSQNFTHSQIILGFDNDDKGQDFTQTCLELFKAELFNTKAFNEETQTKSQIKPIYTFLNQDNQRQNFIIEKPILKDFNDDLNAYKLLNLNPNFTLKELENKISKLHLNNIDDFLKKEKLLKADSYKKRAKDALMLSKILHFLKPKLENYIHYEKIDKSLEKIHHYFQKNIKNNTLNKDY